MSKENQSFIATLRVVGRNLEAVDAANKKKEAREKERTMKRVGAIVEYINSLDERVKTDPEMQKLIKTIVAHHGVRLQSLNYIRPDYGIILMGDSLQEQCLPNLVLTEAGLGIGTVPWSISGPIVDKREIIFSSNPAAWDQALSPDTNSRFFEDPQTSRPLTVRSLEKKVIAALQF